MDKIFAKGIWFNEPSSKAPDYVVGGLAVDTNLFIQFLKEQNQPKVLFEILLSKEGKPYIQVNTWKPKTDARVPSPYHAPEDIVDNKDLPF